MTGSNVPVSSGFSKYVDPKRNVGSQSELPNLKSSGGTLSVSGYQIFDIIEGRVRKDNIAPKFKLIYQYFMETKKVYGSQASLLDIGCSAGLLCFLAKECGFASVTGLDHDPEYIALLKSISSAAGIDITGLVGDWNTAPGTYDVVTTLALIHWIYSLTAAEGSFEGIFRYLASKTKRLLFVEWIEPSDPAIGSLKHISANPKVHKEPYELGRFLAAGERHCGAIETRIDLSSTRRIYCFRKERRVYGNSSVVRFTESSAIKTFREHIVAHEPALIRRETKALTILKGVPGIPLLLACTERELYMTQSGVLISPANIPADAEAQGRALVDIMKRKGVRHNDIHPDNLLVKEGRLYLIDFAWASFGDETPDYLPQDIGVAYGVRKLNEPFDDHLMLERALAIVRDRKRT